MKSLKLLLKIPVWFFVVYFLLFVEFLFFSKIYFYFYPITGDMDSLYLIIVWFPFYAVAMFFENYMNSDLALILSTFLYFLLYLFLIIKVLKWKMRNTIFLTGGAIALGILGYLSGHFLLGT